MVLVCERHLKIKPNACDGELQDSSFKKYAFLNTDTVSGHDRILGQ